MLTSQRDEELLESDLLSFFLSASKNQLATPMFGESATSKKQWARGRANYWVFMKSENSRAICESVSKQNSAPAQQQQLNVVVEIHASNDNHKHMHKHTPGENMFLNSQQSL